VPARISALMATMLAALPAAPKQAANE
jgi:hypothetical protein